MNAKKEQQAMLLQVTEGLQVATFNHPEFDFLIPTKDVAKGYGVSLSAIRSAHSRYSEDLKENVHYVKAVAIQTPLKNVQPHATLWTKKGVIQLGFHIQTGRAIVFRQWAESIIMKVTANSVDLPIVTKRKHNRLTQERMISILADIAQIDDKQLRLSLISKLGI